MDNPLDYSSSDAILPAEMITMAQHGAAVADGVQTLDRVIHQPLPTLFPQVTRSTATFPHHPLYPATYTFYNYSSNQVWYNCDKAQRLRRSQALSPLRLLPGPRRGLQRCPERDDVC